MKLVRSLLLFFFVAVLGSLQAQDIHYTLFNMSPLTLNPANTGAFSGTVRVGGIYRGQWWAVSSERGYNTPSAYADAPIVRGFRDQDWVGVGLSFFQDKSGSLALTTNTSMLSAAYHLGLDKKGESVLTLGLQGGRVNRSLNSQNARLADSWDGSTNIFEDTADPVFTGGTGGGTEPGENDIQTDYFDFRAGLLFRSKFDEFDNIEVGFSTGRINTPEYLFRAGGGNQDFADRPMLLAAHAKYEWKLNDKWSAAPTVLWQSTGGANLFNLQAWAGYDLKPEEKIKVHMGLGYRVGDSAKILAGLDYKDLRVAAAFDLNVSEYRVATDYQGAFEIAAFYIIKVYPDPQIKPAILCPRF